MTKSKTRESCPLCGGEQKQSGKKSRPVKKPPARAGKTPAKVVEPLEVESGDDKTADNFADQRNPS